MNSPGSDTPALIYNLFPLLAGPFEQWETHLTRASRMGFNWIFTNPVNLPGYSGSLYAVKDFYKFHPLLAGEGTRDQGAEKKLRKMLDQAHKLGLKVMLDLVINHTAFDSILVTQHPEWYLRDNDGNIKHPGVYRGGTMVTVWGDLADVDNENSPDRENLWEYWWQLTSHYLSLGFDGFRCDAAYKIPKDLWKFLIPRAKEKFPGTMFFAESLGCTIDKVVELAESGFDYIFNSSKYWDFAESWCLRQYEQTRSLAPSISFAESHDTQRLMSELNGSMKGIRQRLIFSALFSSGMLMPMGFEYGFKKRLHVVKSTPDDWENTEIDFTGLIRQILSYKLSKPLFCYEAPTYKFDLHAGSDNEVTALIKVTADSSSSALLLINRSRQKKQNVVINNIATCMPGGGPIVLESPSMETPSEPVDKKDFSYELPPAGINVIYRK